MKLDRMVKRLYKPLFPLLTTAVISGCSARAEPGYTPTPSTPAPIVRETPTPTYPITITPTPASIPTPLVTPTVTPTPQLPQSMLNQLSYLPDNVRTALIDELKTDTDWDWDGIVNPSDSFVLDPSNTINQPKYQTIAFIKNLKQRNKDGLLPQVYNQLAKALFTVDNNPQYFQETTPDRAHVTVKLVDGIQNITKYPRGLSLGAVQVESLKLTDDHAMQNFVIPAIGYIVSLQEESKIDALNGWGIPDKQLEDEGIRQILLPSELISKRIKTGDSKENWIEVGIENVSYDASLGKSPQEWLGEMVRKDYQDKNSLGYRRAIANSDSGLSPIWDNSYKIFLDELKKLLSSGEDRPAFIRGYPVYLRTGDKIVPQITEQGQPPYSVLVGRSLGISVFVVRADYPKTDSNEKTFFHDEPYTLINRGSSSWIFPYRFGFWLDKSALTKDYNGKVNRPRLQIRNADGTYKELNF